MIGVVLLVQILAAAAVVWLLFEVRAMKEKEESRHSYWLSLGEIRTKARDGVLTDIARVRELVVESATHLDSAITTRTATQTANADRHLNAIMEKLRVMEETGQARFNTVVRTIEKESKEILRDDSARFAELQKFRSRADKNSSDWLRVTHERLHAQVRGARDEVIAAIGRLDEGSKHRGAARFAEIEKILSRAAKVRKDHHAATRQQIGGVATAALMDVLSKSEASRFERLVTEVRAARDQTSAKFGQAWEQAKKHHGFRQANHSVVVGAIHDDASDVLEAVVAKMEAEIHAFKKELMAENEANIDALTTIALGLDQSQSAGTAFAALGEGEAEEMADKSRAEVFNEPEPEPEPEPKTGARMHFQVTPTDRIAACGRRHVPLTTDPGHPNMCGRCQNTYAYKSAKKAPEETE